MVDKPLVLRKLTELDQYRQQAQEFAEVTVAEYKRDWKVQRIVERTLQMMVETCIDVAGHIIADEDLRVPTTYADTFLVLEENRIIDPALLETMKKMTQFRNLVVHHYDKIDPAIVVTILRKNLADFKRFKDAVLAALKI